MTAARFVACISILAAALGGCGGPRANEGREGGMIIERGPNGTQVVRPGRDPNAGYIRAMEFKSKGDCVSAIVLLDPIAKLGPGYENAQTALGECLLGRELEAENGLTWLTRAANAGWPEAQAALAIHFAAARSTEDAAYWLALYEVNPNKARVGFRPPNVRSLADVRNSVSESEWADAVKRAAAWKRDLWLPPPEPEKSGASREDVQRNGRRPPPKP